MEIIAWIHFDARFCHLVWCKEILLFMNYDSYYKAKISKCSLVLTLDTTSIKKTMFINKMDSYTRLTLLKRNGTLSSNKIWSLYTRQLSDVSVTPKVPNGDKQQHHHHCATRGDGGGPVAAIRSAVAFLPVHTVSIQSPVAHVGHTCLWHWGATTNHCSPPSIPDKHAWWLLGYFHTKGAGSDWLFL